MILQGVKLTIQPLGVGNANRPQKAQNGGGGMWLFPLYTPARLGSNNLCEVISKKYETKHPPKPIQPRKAISEGYPKRYNIPPPPYETPIFPKVAQHYSVGRVRGNLAVLTPPPPCQTPICMGIFVGGYSILEPGFQAFGRSPQKIEVKSPWYVVRF